ncbi:MAG: LuxR family transcriptional regulator [Herpetosiphon sp.]
MTSLDITMPDLPTGTVTFLLTDLQGSTALWELHPHAAHAAFVRHDDIIETVVDRYGGQVVRPRGEGDSRFAVFTRATDAVAAAAALQHAFTTELWKTPAPLHVRMALHTGEADLRAGDYYGTSVNRCARLRAIAHGGQTLLSQATFDIVRDMVIQELLPGVSLRDLGEHRLKDLIRPEHVYQLVIAGLPDLFPALPSLDVHHHNLPVQRSPLLGREQEVGDVTALLRRQDVGLVTLTGPGGTGKTRLSLQVAGELIDSFPDGVFFVELAPITDPALVLAAIARILPVQETAGEALPETLQAFLRMKHMLIVLDNFEQVTAAAPVVTQLLQGAAQLKILATSREALHLRIEQEYAVQPLQVPNLKRLPPFERLSQYAAVQLFIQRTRAIKPDFHITNLNAPAVAEICVRLDGLPLAIELAAARVKLLSPDAMLQRLSNRLRMLTGGSRDLPARQQTLRAAIDWSYSLLTPAEQTLFARLGVFIGGWTLEAAEAVCAEADATAPDVLDGLQSLVDKSLIRQMEQPGDEPRFAMLETIREYARERLVALGAMPAQARHHADYFRELAILAGREQTAPGIQAWMIRLDPERDNLLASLTWHADYAQGTPEVALAFVRALSGIWKRSLALTEGRRWLSWALALPGASDFPELYAQVLREIGWLALVQWDFAAAQGYLETSLAILRDIGDTTEVANSLTGLARVFQNQGQWWLAEPLLEESLVIQRQVGNTFGTAYALMILAEGMELKGDWIAAGSRAAEALQLAHERGDESIIGWALVILARVALVNDDVALARTRSEESVVHMRKTGYKANIAASLQGLAAVAVEQCDFATAHTALDESSSLYPERDYTPAMVDALIGLAALYAAQHEWLQARSLYRECLVRLPDANDKQAIVRTLEGLAQVFAHTDQLLLAVRLWGAAAAYREHARSPRVPWEQAAYRCALATAQTALGASPYKQALAAGQELTLDHATMLALESTRAPAETQARR